MLIRQTAPVIGADGSTYTPVGEWQLNFATRNLRSTDHYNTTVEQLQRQTLGTYVVNLQNAFDVTVGYQLTQRTSLMVGVPFVSASWSIPRPTAPTPGPRAQEDSMGLGDISVSARTWVLSPKAHSTGNFAVGLGVKMPTGKSDVTDTFVGSNGQVNTARYVDMSVQPGDGGWGITTDISGFKLVRRFMVFGSVNYLINPRDTSGTPTNGQVLGSTPTPNTTQVNSTPDQYLVRVGTATSIGKGFSASIAWRMEGLPRYDLIGRSDGFRRPGKEMFIEPGIAYSTGRSSFSVSIPWGYYRNREPNPYTDTFGDATFPRFIVLGNYSLRFGGLKGLQRPRLGPGTISSLNNGSQPGAGADGVAAPSLPMPSLDRGQEMVTFDVTGMTCDDCVETVQKALQNVNGVVSARVNLARHEALVVYEPSKTKIADLVKVVKATKGMNRYSAEPESATATLAVTGMTCDQCADSVRSALLAVKGVSDAKVSLESRLATVTYDPTRVKPTDLVKAVKGAKGMNPYTATVQQD